VATVQSECQAEANQEQNYKEGKSTIIV